MRPGISLAGVPFYWPGGVRHIGGASLFCGFCTERRKAGSDNALAAAAFGWWPAGGERESAGRQKSRGTEYRCGIRWRTGS